MIVSVSNQHILISDKQNPEKIVHNVNNRTEAPGRVLAQTSWTPGFYSRRGFY